MKHFIHILFFLLALNLPAQEQAILDNFRIYNLDGKVLLNWQIVQGSTCYGIGISRSVNQSEFIEIGNIAGVCGFSNDPQGYQFIDENPIKNQVNQYRLDLGGYGFSKILEIEINEEPRVDLQLFPNPVTSTSKLYFENKKHKKHFLYIFNSTGKLMDSPTTSSDYFDIHANSYHSGIYLYTLKSISGEVLTTGKFIIR